MITRKGELSKREIDQGWPYQVALEERFCIGENYIKHRLFCTDLSLCKRGHAFNRDGRYFNVFCFAEPEHAQTFHARFGGELMLARERPKWPGR